MKKLAIIGASYLQEPLIQKAKAMGIETHVFAWATGDVGEKSADHFYPISIVEKEEILAQCRAIGIDGICSIASDLAMLTVNFVAEAMGLCANSVAATQKSTNKNRMRRAFENGGDPSPRSVLVDETSDLSALALEFPVIVKPTDRSGSRGICKLSSPAGLEEAVGLAISQSFEKKALVEEFAGGQEYSVECISFAGEHHFLAMTKKFTTGAPHFIETGHLQPAPVSGEMLERVRKIVFHALDTLGLMYGASHSEIKIDSEGRIRIIEIGGRMGGDLIGSDLVRLSTGIDFVRAVIQVALGEKPDLTPASFGGAAAVRFVFTEKDAVVVKAIQKDHPDLVVSAHVEACEGTVTDSSNRFGYCLMKADKAETLLPFLPTGDGSED